MIYPLAIRDFHALNLNQVAVFTHFTESLSKNYSIYKSYFCWKSAVFQYYQKLKIPSLSGWILHPWFSKTLSSSQRLEAQPLWNTVSKSSVSWDKIRGLYRCWSRKIRSEDISYLKSPFESHGKNSSPKSVLEFLDINLLIFNRLKEKSDFLINQKPV